MGVDVLEESLSRGNRKIWKTEKWFHSLYIRSKEWDLQGLHSLWQGQSVLTDSADTN